MGLSRGREAQMLAALNHPNIAVIHELKEVDGSMYLILELVEGETLAHGLLEARFRWMKPWKSPGRSRKRWRLRTRKESFIGI